LKIFGKKDTGPFATVVKKIPPTKQQRKSLILKNIMHTYGALLPVLTHYGALVVVFSLQESAISTFLQLMD